jgi:hypothetical protein
MTLGLKKQTTFDPVKMRKQIRTLYKSRKGRTAMRKAAEASAKASKDLEESFAVDVTQLDVPVTF